MIKLRLQVPVDRTRTAAATLSDDGKLIATEDAVASASAAVASAQGNAACDPLRPYGHPPLGAYRLIHRERVEARYREEYGPHVLLFEPTSGPALEAESFGRLGLLVFGGAPGYDARMRRTQGGVRLTNGMLDRLAGRLKPGTGLTLELVALKPTVWWAFWRKPVRTQLLSSDPPQRMEAPWDEMSLLRRLLDAAPRRARAAVNESDTSDTERTSRDRSSTSSSGGDSFRGGGGQFGGAGASGRWGDAPGAVDHTGRIVAGAVAGAAVAGIATAAADRSGDTSPAGTGDDATAVADASASHTDASDTTAY